MKQDTRHLLMWGWLRLFLATIQLVFAPLAIFAVILSGGGHWLTWLLIIVATLATAVSWLLYHGRPDPRLRKEDMSHE